VIRNQVNFQINVKLTDAKNNLIVKKLINQDSSSFSGYTRAYMEITLFSFNASRNEK
jgi:hypothetical protein